jgi:hypothetical protein
MPSKFKKGEQVRVLATTIDSEEERDSSGRLFSEKWAHDGHGSY